MTVSGYLMPCKLLQGNYLVKGAPHGENICSFTEHQDC